MAICQQCGETIDFITQDGRAVPIHRNGPCNPAVSSSWSRDSRSHIGYEFKNEGSLCRPTHCPECGDEVFFIRHNGGSVWLEPPLGAPWNKHPCFEEDEGDRALEYLKQSPDDGWAFGLVTRARSQTFGNVTALQLSATYGDDILALVKGDAIAGALIGQLVAFHPTRGLLRVANKAKLPVQILEIQSSIEDMNAFIVRSEKRFPRITQWLYLFTGTSQYERRPDKEYSMPQTYSLMILPGDGIGPEVMAEVRKLIAHLEKTEGLKFELQDGLIGGASIDAHGEPLTDATLEKCQKADAVLLGAVGGPKWDNVAYDIRPEAGLLKIRKAMDLFANLRPAIVFDALLDASTLKPEIVKGLDIMIVRELTGGVYFGEPRGITDLGNGERRGVNTQVYTTSEIRRVGKVAFELARKRGNRVTSCEKANVMESGKLWREDMTKLHAEQYKDVALSHMYADNCAMQLLRNPRQFDVIVTDNLFGDILSDEAAMLTGSLGMLPSASLGAEDPATGKRKALYEPVHGSAPDIAGQGLANPLATILSFSMCLRYSFDLSPLADRIDAAAQSVLSNGIRTGDIMADGCKKVSTAEMGDALIGALATAKPRVAAAS